MNIPLGITRSTVLIVGGVIRFTSIHRRNIQLFSPFEISEACDD